MRGKVSKEDDGVWGGFVLNSNPYPLGTACSLIELYGTVEFLSTPTAHSHLSLSPTLLHYILSKTEIEWEEEGVRLKKTHAAGRADTERDPLNPRNVPHLVELTWMELLLFLAFSLCRCDGE